MFKPVSSKVDFPSLEERILAFWREREVFRRTWDERGGAPLFVLYEGPPTANGSPGIHHVLARVYKDVIPRFKTMKGYRVLRKGGWDTHGLPVELEVEKELGISTKPEIETYGIERFNARCRESVFRYVKEWEAMTERVAFWIDMKHAYVTCENDYIESVWWILRQLWDAGLIYRGVKSAPHCPRCVTTLSSHEVALGYQENTPDPSVYVQFRVVGGESPLARELASGGAPVYILAWTTTPWTLPGNTALAVHPQAEYSLVEVEKDGKKERLVLATKLLGSALVGDYTVLHGGIRGEALEGLRYEPLYDPFRYEAAWPTPSIHNQPDTIVRLRPDGGASLGRRDSFPGTYPVITSDFVTLEDGTGVVHIAPAFGQEDYEAGLQHGLYFVQHVDLQGKVLGRYPFAGKFVKEADPLVMEDLAQRGLLYGRGVYHHTYPFCWRCDAPLLYYAKPSWYIRTTEVKDRLVSANQEINWFPEHVKEGRFGEWLRNNVDWAISRERYWGTPIPLWGHPTPDALQYHYQMGGDEEDAYLCVGSREELEGLAVKEDKARVSSLDLHRPYVDAIQVRCPTCGEAMRRIPEVMDCWFDSGAMPLAQFHYPLENATAPQDGRYPGDYICEAVDQTRGWFYSLHAVATLLEKATGGKVTAPSFRNVICLGLVMDEKGDKMSKSRGNVVNPWDLLRAHGADALRWYLYTASAPGNSRRFSAGQVEEVVRRFHLILWNTYSFFVTYANLDGFDPSASPKVMPTSDLDRWVLSELNMLVGEVSQLLDSYNPTDAGRRIEGFVDMLSTWYVRRSRRRFWKSVNDEDKLSAYHT
ncbi:MAG: isoleucine--tRNA ligase, partial [Chloroflexi bacterium]|nr:isoleucine--tRNA ligase [Chloroflexota bacterium]